MTEQKTPQPASEDERPTAELTDLETEEDTRGGRGLLSPGRAPGARGPGGATGPSTPSISGHDLD